MNNLHRELAPISAEAWGEIDAEARRTFERHVAGRRVVDVRGPEGSAFSAVGPGHQSEVDAPAEGIRARLREVQTLVELRVPFTVSRQAVDDVDRGAKDADWQPVKDAAKKIAFAEDQAIFAGYAAAGIGGVVPSSTNTALVLPPEVKDYPIAVAQALSALRLAGVNGPYSLLLSAQTYTEVTETTDHGYPIHQHLSRVLGDGEIIWAPAIEGAVVISGRGGDYELYLGQDLSIGYLAHDAETVELYFQESFTFVVQSAEAAVGIAGH